jgi:hypothetical protein
MKVRVMVHESDRTPCMDLGSPMWEPMEGKSGQMLVEGYLAEKDLPTWEPSTFPCRHNKPAIIVTCELKIPEKEIL